MSVPSSDRQLVLTNCEAASTILTSVKDHSNEDDAQEKVELETALVLVPWCGIANVRTVKVSLIALSGTPQAPC